MDSFQVLVNAAFLRHAAVPLTLLGAVILLMLLSAALLVHKELKRKETPDAQRSADLDGDLSSADDPD